MKEIRDLKVICEDSFELSATLFIPDQLKASVMIGPATGIKQTFYRSFAMHLAKNGFGVITFDNRGIGLSRKGDLHRISLIHWGQQDMTAILNTLKENFPGTACHLIGHSAGGQLLGLMENALEIKSMFNFASSSGSLRNMKYPYKLKASFYLNFFIPVNILIFGRTNSQWVGMGEPLPKKVASQWSKWCNGEGYVKTDFGKAIAKHLYDDISIPTLWLHATDDDIANTKNVEDMIKVYSKIDSKIMALDPDQLGYPDIGHMKFFSSKKKELWSKAVNWLNKN